MGRAISDKLKMDLIEGGLKGLLCAVKNDNTLIMELRGNEGVTIYYRGGALFNISEKNNKYTVFYNKDYWRKGKIYDELKENPYVEEALKYIALYKHQMDFHRANASRELEKQAQQQLVLENNILGGKNLGEDKKSRASTGDYFILDIEYAYRKNGLNARFDAIALKWPSLSSDRRNRKNLGISFLELKYYDGTMKGSSGIKKHISDFIEFTRNEKTRTDYIDMCQDMEKVFKQKGELGLIPSYTSRLDMAKSEYLNISIDPDNVEMIFAFVNRDPDSTEAVDALKECLDKYGENALKNIYIATSSDMGYVLFRYGQNGKKDRYLSIPQFIEA